MKFAIEILSYPHASRILDQEPGKFHQLVQSALDRHNRSVSEKAGEVRKDSPESCVSVVNLPGQLRVCVKEFRWRGWLHTIKGLVRPTQALRTFRNGMLLDARGIGAARPLVLIRKKFLGIAMTEWIVMEVIPDALELDRHILTRVNASWSTEERRSLIRSFGRFIGSMHGKGIFHSDLKTCNILVSDERRQRGEQSPGGPHPLVRFSLVDYDDVSFGRHVSERKKIKNLVQIFLSTPLAIGTTDRLRFLSEYALHAGIDRHHRRKIAWHVLEAVRGRNILYVGFQGDVIEQWE